MNTITPAKELLNSLVKLYINTYMLSQDAFSILSIEDHNTVALNLIMSNAAGAGSPALDSLCSLADKTNCAICLQVEAKSNNHKALTKAQLHKWYKKRGFVQNEEYRSTDCLIRFPV